MALDKATTLMASSAYEAGTMAQVAAGAVEACWKLGQWKELGHALSKVSESSADQSASGSQLWVLSPDVGAETIVMHVSTFETVVIPCSGDED